MAATRGTLRIFVGNVPWTVSKRELKEYFSQFGHVVMANIAVDRQTGLGRGYGFVRFSSRDGYIAATNRETHTIEGHTVTVQSANDNTPAVADELGGQNINFAINRNQSPK